MEQEKLNGYGFKSWKMPKMKPFSLDDLKDTWFMSIPDGEGMMTNTWGRWINGQRIQDGSEIVPDPFYKPRIPDIN